MKFKIDHDLHIHSNYSLCSGNPLQTPEKILNYAKENNLNTICLTDHYWDQAVAGGSDWYMAQTDIDVMKPLPQSENCKFLFGCETDMDKNFKIGLLKPRMEEMDFIIVPTTHSHTPEGLAQAKERFEKMIDFLDLTEDDKFHIG